MVKWYDYIAAIVIADLLLTIFLTVPIFGAVIAFVIYEYVWEGYCQYRLQMEEDDE